MNWLQAAKYAKGKGLKVHILSDANEVFIGTILRFHGIEGLFDSVTTNPARFVKTSDDLPELLEIGPYQPKGTPHGCTGLCPINMCKGKPLKAMGLAKPGGVDVDSTTPVLYVGDGTGDLCPCLLLTK
jgi:pyridoxal phosphate phosphatase PHOSPHO2